MTFVSRSRANSDINSTRYRDGIHQVFPSYMMPHDVSTMSRYLGTSLLTIDYSCSKVMFYQVTEVEVDNNSSSSEEEQLSTLPPKKRKRQRVTRSQLIFCLEHDHQQEMDTTRQYFLFPQEAIVESINTNSPFEVLISYHAPSIPNVEFKQSRRRLTDPGIPHIHHHHQVMHVRLSCVSNELYTALKQTVSDFENIYRKMMELRKLHSHHLTMMNTEIANKLVINEWTSEEDEEMKTEEDDDDDFVLLSSSSPNISKSNASSRSNSSTPSSTKQCLYCGSKSTPMWRRGPQGAGTLCNACGVKWKHGKILCEHNPTDHKVEKKKRKYTTTTTTKKSTKKTTVIEDDLNKLTVQETTPLSSVEEAAALLTLLKQS